MGRKARKRIEVIKEQINKFNKAKIGYLKRSTEITLAVLTTSLPPCKKRRQTTNIRNKRKGITTNVEIQQVSFIILEATF